MPSLDNNDSLQVWRRLLTCIRSVPVNPLLLAPLMYLLSRSTRKPSRKGCDHQESDSLISQSLLECGYKYWSKHHMTSSFTSHTCFASRARPLPCKPGAHLRLQPAGIHAGNVPMACLCPVQRRSSKNFLFREFLQPVLPVFRALTLSTPSSHALCGTVGAREEVYIAIDLASTTSRWHAWLQKKATRRKERLIRVF